MYLECLWTAMTRSGYRRRRGCGCMAASHAFREYLRIHRRTFWPRMACAPARPKSLTPPMASPSRPGGAARSATSVIFLFEHDLSENRFHFSGSCSTALHIAIDGFHRPRRPAISSDHEQRADDRQILQRLHEGLGAVGRRLIPEIMEIEGHRGNVEDQKNC